MLFLLCIDSSQHSSIQRAMFACVLQCSSHQVVTFVNAGSQWQSQRIQSLLPTTQGMGR